MKNELFIQLSEIREQTDCKNKYICLSETYNNPCIAKLSAITNSAGCPNPENNNCKYLDNTTGCQCPLRKFVAKNYQHFTTLQSFNISITPKSLSHINSSLI